MITKISLFKESLNKINENMNNQAEEQLNYVDNILPILKKFYTGSINAAYTAEKLVETAIEILNDPEDVLAYIKIVAQIPDRPDNITASNSFFNYITDIDTEIHSELDNFDYVMNNITRTLASIK